jgi:hypothetical protein
MALGGLLLLLQAGITRAWKERSTLGVGREMERGTAATPRKAWKRVKFAIRQLKRYGGLQNCQAQKQQHTGFSIAEPEKYPCQNYHV